MIRLAAASLSFDGFDDLDFARTFELAPEIGFRNLELNCWYPRNITGRAVQSIKSRSAAAGVQPVSLHFTGPTGTDHKDRIKDLALAMRGIDMANELGCTVLCTLGAPRKLDGSFDSLLALLDELVPYAEEAGITIALENHDGHALQTIEDYRRILSRFASERLGVCADIGHFHASGVSNDEIIANLGDQVMHIHVKDNLEFGKKQFVPFGQGTADNAGFVRAMSERGYDGLVVVELSPGGLDLADRETHVRALHTAYDMFAPFEKE